MPARRRLPGPCCGGGLTRQASQQNKNRSSPPARAGNFVLEKADLALCALGYGCWKLLVAYVNSTLLLMVDITVWVALHLWWEYLIKKRKAIDN